MLIYLLLIFSIYFAFLFACVIGWKKFLHATPTPGMASQELVSVIVAARNEEHSITRLLDSIRHQDYPHIHFEVICVDDHSTDKTSQSILDWRTHNSSIQCNYVFSSGKGKKAALLAGIQSAKGKIILTTDADCVLPQNWISKMVMSFSQDTTMVIGLVMLQPDESLFSKLQALEFSSLISSGIALNELGFPVMCNGASLAFRKDCFEAVNGYEDNQHIPSGDDEFLMRKLAKRFPGSIQTVRGTFGVVSTRPQKSLKSFIYQRIRWAGKWKANDSIISKGLALFILIFQFANLLAMVFLVLGENMREVTALLAIKVSIEGYFLYMVSNRLNQSFSVAAFILLQLMYPFYVIMIGILSQLLDYEWKGRKVASIG